ncbi:MAG: hypothetical protein GYB36_01675 [Alphaproteobacteria bacterium]|nr:hypothetical protein [Alphaproteobacteria bacterium]
MVSALVGSGYYYVSQVNVFNALKPDLERWTDELVEPQIARLTEIADLNTAARDAYLSALVQHDGRIENSVFDRAFPLFGDGTRRSAPDLFDGMTTPEGEQVYGIGAFVGDADAMTEDQRLWFWLGYETIRRLGPERVDPEASLYYFTADRRAVLFGPHRTDRLEFYRINAPADFNMRGDEDHILFGEEANPARELQCTKISRYISDDAGERSSMACRIPIWQGDVLLGALGSSFDATALLDVAANASLEGGTVWLLDRDQTVITRHASQGHQMHGHSMGDMLARVDADTQSGAFRIDNSLISFRRIPHANWVLITCVQIDGFLAPLQLRAWLLSFLVFALLSLAAALKSGLLPRLLPSKAALHSKPAE